MGVGSVGYSWKCTSTLCKPLFDLNTFAGILSSVLERQRAVSILLTRFLLVVVVCVTILQIVMYGTRHVDAHIESLLA